MTEASENRSPEYLVRVTHPDPNIGLEQVRIDAESSDSAPDVARKWLADAHSDLRWLDAPAELVDESAPEPEGVGTLQAPEPRQSEQGQGGDQGQGGGA